MIEFDKYMSKPMVKHGKELTEENAEDIVEFIIDKGKEAKVVRNRTKGTTYVEIVTEEGTMRADVGTYVMYGSAGEFWAIQPDIFKNTYEEYVEESTEVVTKSDEDEVLTDASAEEALLENE